MACFASMMSRAGRRLQLSYSGSVPLGFDQCVGYDVPLFLGGADTIENLHVEDIDVYWSLTAQLRAATRNVPPGTPISGVES
jgi:hypothetical protein